MTIYELIQKLQDIIISGRLKADSIIYLSSDSEGNSYFQMDKDFQFINKDKIIFYPDETTFVTDNEIYE